MCNERPALPLAGEATQALRIGAPCRPFALLLGWQSALCGRMDSRGFPYAAIVSVVLVIACHQIQSGVGRTPVPLRQIALRRPATDLGQSTSGPLLSQER